MERLKIYKEDGEELYWVDLDGKMFGTICKTPDGVKPWTFTGPGLSLGGNTLDAVISSVKIMLVN